MSSRVDILAQERRDQVARALALAFPGHVPQWRYENLLLLYSGGTAPDSHRLPHFAIAIQLSERGDPSDPEKRCQALSPKRNPAMAAESRGPTWTTCPRASAAARLAIAV